MVLVFGIMPGSQRSYCGLAMLVVLVVLVVTDVLGTLSLALRDDKCDTGDEPPRSVVWCTHKCLVGLHGLLCDLVRLASNGLYGLLGLCNLLCDLVRWMSLVGLVGLVGLVNPLSLVSLANLFGRAHWAGRARRNARPG